MNDEVLDMIVDADLDTKAEDWETEQEDTMQYCAQCDARLINWTYLVENADGEPVCGACYQGSIDTAHDERKEVA